MIPTVFCKKTRYYKKNGATKLSKKRLLGLTFCIVPYKWYKNIPTEMNAIQKIKIYEIE